MVEPRGRVRPEPARKRLGLPLRGGQRDALQSTDDVAKGVGPRRLVGPVNALPLGQEPCEHLGVGGLHLAAQAGHRHAPEAPEHLGVAPLVAAPARAHLTAHQQSLGLHQREGLLGEARRRPEARRGIGGPEGAVGTRVSRQQALKCARHGLEERIGQPGLGHHAQAVAVAAGVLARDQPLLAGHPGTGGAAFAEQHLKMRIKRRRVVQTQAHLVGRQVAKAPQQVVHPVGAPRPALGVEPLQLHLKIVERLGVDEVAQLVLPQQFAQQVAVERKRLGTPFGGRCVVVVHVRRHVFEQQRTGEGRRVVGLHLGHRDLAAAHPREQILQRRQVEPVVQALAVGLEDHGERPEAAGNLQQAAGLQPLLPQRRAATRVTTRDEQGTRGVLAEARPEQRRAAQFPQDEVLQVVRVGDEHVGGRQRVAVHQMAGDAVVAPDHVGVGARELTQPRLHGQRPRGVHTGAEGGEDAQAPVADLVAEALDHDAEVAWHRAGGLHLVLHVLNEVLRGAVVEPRVGLEARGGVGGVGGCDLARHAPHGRAQFVRPAHALAAPERHRARGTGDGGHQHAVAGDLLDAPCGGTEHECLPGAGLVHHLLVQLAHARAAVGKEHAEQAAVGDGARVLHRQATGAVAPAHGALRAVPHHPGLQFGELIRRVAAGQHVEHALQLIARQVAERMAAACHLQDLVNGHGVVARHHGHHLLRQHVERQAGHVGFLDGSLAHALHHRGALEQVAAVLGEDASAARHVNAVAGTAHTLDATGDAARALHLNHQVNGAHVHAQFERRGGHQRGDAPGLQVLLDDGALLARQRAVVGARDVLLGQFVQAQREALGRPAVVHEDQRAAMGLHQFEQRRVHGGPDAAPGGATAQDVGELGLVGSCGLVHLAHVVNRHHHLEVELLHPAGINHAHRPRCAVLVLSAQEAGDLAERPLRGRQADALDGLLGHTLQPLHRQRQVAAALGAGHRVDLVDDDPGHPLEDLRALAGEQQIEALRSGDEDVGRVAQHALALRLGGVARAHAHRDVGRVEPHAPGRLGDARERPAQVALHVVVQRLEGRDVEQPPGLAALQAVLRQAVEAPQEGGERLARPRGGHDERVIAGGDARPSLHLRRRRPLERPREPVRHHRVEGRECVGSGRRGHGWTVPRRAAGLSSDPWVPTSSLPRASCRVRPALVRVPGSTAPCRSSC